MTRDHVLGWSAHSPDRPGLSRRRFLGTAAAAAGLALGPAVWTPLRAGVGVGRNGDPKPIPGGTSLTFPTPTGPVTVFVHFNPGITDQSREALLITDFNGAIAVARNTGAGTATVGGASSRLVFSTDVRVMSGTYKDVNGRLSRGTFCFL